MRACDLLISGGTILELDAPTGVAAADTVVVVGDEIAAVGHAADLLNVWNPRETIDARGHYVAPGFVDGHVHLTAYLGAAAHYRPAQGPGLFSGAARPQDILPRIVQMCRAPVTDEVVAAATRPVYAALDRAGCTGVVDAGGAGHRGARPGRAGRVRQSRDRPLHRRHLARRARPPRASGRPVRRAGGRRNRGEGHRRTGGGLVRAVVSAIETMACSDELLCGLADLVARLDLPTHVHTHISPASVEGHRRARGVSPTATLLDAGLLTPRCTVMHVGALTDDDIETFAACGVTANHNPLGNAMLGFGTAHARSLPRLLDASVPVLLGSDYAPSMVATPFDLLRACLIVNREAAAADDSITLEQALAMSVDTGTALGHPGRLGRIAPGRLADLICVRRTGSHHTGVTHPVPGLALRARAADVTTTIVGGQVVVRDGRLASVDEAELVAEAERALAHLR